MLYKNEIVYDDSNAAQLTPDDDGVLMVDGQERHLCAVMPNAAAVPSITLAAAGIPKIPRNEWSARLKEQTERRARVSDFCDFDPLNQGRHLSCWGEGTNGTARTLRRIQRLPFVALSTSSITVPVTGGVDRGGFEGDSLRIATEKGLCRDAIWPTNAIDTRYMRREDVAADRVNFKVLEWINAGRDFDTYATCCLQTMTGPFAYTWMRHVMQICDLVEIEAGSFGLRNRNSWGAWGAKNEHGKFGFAVYREGPRGTPTSGYMARQITAYIG